MWKRTDALSERVKFILEWERRWQASKGRIEVAELSRLYGVSRQTAHVWIKRYQAAGHDLRVMQDRVVAARKQHPRWGPLKLRAWLVERHPQLSFPSVSGIGAVLRRRGMTAARKPRRSASIPATIAPPFADCERPNDVWCMDFKGWFHTHDGIKCYPFTLIDALSRVLLRCEALTEPNGDFVRHFLDSAFREYGLPKRLRSDGGPPFFSAASPASLSRLGVWPRRSASCPQPSCIAVPPATIRGLCCPPATLRATPSASTGVAGYVGALVPSSSEKHWLSNALLSGRATATPGRSTLMPSSSVMSTSPQNAALSLVVAARDRCGSPSSMRNQRLLHIPEVSGMSLVKSVRDLEACSEV